MHADHVTGAWLLKAPARQPRSLVAGTAAPRARTAYLADGDRVAFGDRHLEVRATPGHTSGCLTYVLDDASMAFTGDCLLIRGSGRTDFQQGDPHAPVPLGARADPDAAAVLPPLSRARLSRPHRHERRRGAALQSAHGRRDRRGGLRRLHAQPRTAAPEADGHRGAGEPALRTPRVRCRAAGRTGLGAADLHVRRVLGNPARRRWRSARRDCRSSTCASRDEFDGPLGRIRGAVAIPLSELCRQRSGELSRIVRSSPCAARARARPRRVVLLQKAGFGDVANLAGGMVRWRAEGHPVEGGAGVAHAGTRARR